MPYDNPQRLSASTTTQQQSPQSDEREGVERSATYAVCSCSTAAFGVCTTADNKCPLDMPWKCLRQLRLFSDS